MCTKKLEDFPDFNMCSKGTHKGRVQRPQVTNLRVTLLTAFVKAQGNGFACYLVSKRNNSMIPKVFFNLSLAHDAP